MPKFPRFWEHVSTRLPWINPLGASLLAVGQPLLLTSLGVTGLVLGMRQGGWLELPEMAAYDYFVQQQPDQGEDPRLLVVGVTETDLQTLQEWPLSDRTLASALKALDRYQPRVVGIDIFRDIPVEPGRSELLKQLDQSKHTVIICKASSPDGPGTPPPTGLPAEKVGFADLVVDPGGTLRRNLLMQSPAKANISTLKPHICSDPQRVLFSIGFHVALRYLQVEHIDPKMTAANQLQLGSVVIPPLAPNTGAYRKADMGGYQILLRYRSANHAVRQISLLQLLQGQVDPTLIRDRIVLIGYTTAEAKDDFYTPYSIGRKDKQKMSGVVVHAQAASQILSTVLDQQPLTWVWSPLAEVLWIWGWSLGGGILGWYLRHPVRFVLVMVLGFGSLYGISLLIFFQGGWIPLVPAILTLAGTAVGVVLLDRFNNSAYGQTVYKRVKTLLRLDIAIDENKLQQQVSEITESNYFQNLQNTVRSLRRQTSKGPSKLASPRNLADHPEPTPHWNHKRDGTGELSHTFDTLLQPSVSNAQVTLPSQGVNSETNDKELKYLLQFKRQKRQSVSSISETSGVADNVDAGPHQQRAIPRSQPNLPRPMVSSALKGSALPLEDAFCCHKDTSAVTQAYLAHLQNELNSIRAALDSPHS